MRWHCVWILVDGVTGKRKWKTVKNTAVSASAYDFLPHCTDEPINRAISDRLPRLPKRLSERVRVCPLRGLPPNPA